MYVVLRRLSCGCVVRGRLGLVRLGVVLDRCGIEISWSLGVVGWGSIRSRVVLGDFDVVGWGRILGGVVLGNIGDAVLRRLGDVIRDSVICSVTLQSWWCSTWGPRRS
jgi:hypothetical protein